MQNGHASELVRKTFKAWETKNKSLMESLLADDFVFSSPNGDDHINKAEYWQKCWPGAANIQSFDILNLIDDGSDAFIRYECQLKDGKRFRNTEYFRIEGNKIKEVD